MGDFALAIASAYPVGTAPGKRTILSAMDIVREEFFANFGRSINDLILSHRSDLERKRKITRPLSEPKMRWVDQTPEYSLHIYALRQLFPQALFIHALRDARDVVHSMLKVPSCCRDPHRPERRAGIQVLAAHGQGVRAGGKSLRPARGSSHTIFGSNR